MDKVSIPLGPFVASRLIGVGGMGEVWRGVHRKQGVPVALKVITAARARSDRYLEAFRDEVRAVAGLDHSGVVLVFDYGEVDAAAEKTSGGRMVAGSPYLAMELALGGSLRTRPLPASWAALKSDLTALLDVLAHAHAKGVTHRDLKPANVLITEDRAPSGKIQRLKLTDFGLAHAAERSTQGIRGTSGTPTFMAPEQFLGEWRDFGPWTDLYAFGCMAYALASGAPPFQVKGFSALMQAHLLSEPPPLVPSLPVPDGFSAWLARLMEKDPLQRFQCAADAAFALEELGEPSASARPGVRPVLMTAAGGATITLTPSFAAWRDLPSDEGPVYPDAAVSVASLSRPQLRMLPPLPDSWRRDDPPRPNMRLVGAGLGLYGLRTIPLVDRESERDAVWGALAAARASGETQLVLLHGSAGSGKSRLAEWISERAREVGAAVAVKATHSASGGPADGLPRLVARAMGCTGMSRAAVVQRAERWMRIRGVDDPYEWNAVAEVMWPSSEAERRDEGSSVRFSRAAERYAVVQRLFGHLSRAAERVGGGALHRPVIVWLDDVQWGGDALGFAEYLLRSGHQSPSGILLLLTARDEALDDRPAERARLEALLASPRALRVAAGPLARGQRTELVRTLLGLEGELAAQVEERTGGNPLFAVQLVGDWVQRGVLEPGERGFVLRKGERAVLPDDIHALWEERIRRTLEGFGADVRPALEMAALLGNDVDDAEWTGACQIARLVIPDALLPTLLARRLAQSGDGGWSFAHGMLRESLERSARESGRATSLHDACATMLQIRWAAGRRPGLAERLGRHLYESGRFEEALEPLRVGAEERRALSEYAEAMRLLDLSVAVMDRVGLPPSEPRRGEAAVMRSELLVGMGRLDEGEQQALGVAELARQHGWTHLLAAALRQAGTVSAKRGRYDEAEERFSLGEAAALARGDDRARGQCLGALGDVSRLRGDHGVAMKRCEQALGLFSALGDARGQADVLLGMSGVCRAMSDLAACESYARRAIPLFERVGNRFGVAHCHNILGDVLRGRDHLAEAAEAYRRAESLLGTLGSAEQIVPRINLGLVLVARKRYSKAQHVLTSALDTIQRDGRRGLEGALHAFLLPCVAVQADWSRWRTHAERARELLGVTGFVDHDIAWSAQLAGELAASAGARDEAKIAFDLSLVQWRGLGSETAVREVETFLHALLHPPAAVDTPL